MERTPTADEEVALPYYRRNMDMMTRRDNVIPYGSDILRAWGLNTTSKCTNTYDWVMYLQKYSMKVHKVAQ